MHANSDPSLRDDPFKASYSTKLGPDMDDHRMRNITTCASS